MIRLVMPCDFRLHLKEFMEYECAGWCRKMFCQGPVTSTMLAGSVRFKNVYGL